MRCPRAASPSAKTAFAAGRNGGKASDVTNRMSSFWSLRSTASSMGQAQRCGRTGAPVGRQRELIDDRGFEARESALAHALAVKMAQHVRVTADRGEAAQRRQQP